MDFLKISVRSGKKGVQEIYPKIICKSSKDLMIRGGDFYAIWDEDNGVWTTNQDSALQMIDHELDKYKSGYEVTSFAVSNFDKGINGKLREGAIIDIYAVDPATDELTLYVSDVYVSGAYDSSGNELTTEGGVAQSFTVYVKSYEVEDMNKAINYGEIHIHKK